MHAAAQFFRQHGMDATLALDAAQTGECVRNDPYAKMSLAPFAGASMPRMQRAFVFDNKFRWRERRVQFLHDIVANQGDFPSNVFAEVKHIVFLFFYRSNP
jgi:hypothetical protein